MDSNRTVLLVRVISLILIVSFLPSMSIAQSTTSLSGYVYDREDRTPLAAAQVQIATGGFRTQTDSRGFFTLENINAGTYSVTVAAPGYKKIDSLQVTIHQDVTSSLVVYLEKKVYRLGGIRVIDSTLRITGDKTIVIGREQIRKMGHLSLADLLQNIEGVQVQRTGTSSGEIHVSIRGSQPKHVLVLLDGQKLNPPQTGVADLQSIPLEMIERIEVYTGGVSAEFGADALAGAINIISHPSPHTQVRDTRTSGLWGSWHTRQIGFSFSNPVRHERLTTRALFSSKRSQGDFDFAYAVEPTQIIYRGKRLNNYFESDNYFLSGNYELSDHSSLKFSGQLYDSRNGLPGRAIRQNTNASKEDKRRMLSATMSQKPSAVLNLDLNLGYQQFNQRFNDTLSAPVNRFHSEYTNDQLTAGISGVWRPVYSDKISFGLQLRDEGVRHTDYLRHANSLGESTRRHVGLFISNVKRFDISALRIFTGVGLDFALRYDWSETINGSESNDIGAWSPSVGGTLSYQGHFDFILRVNYGRSFRLPSINSLFWKSDLLSLGNPYLRPERAEHSEIGAELKYSYRKMSLHGNVTYFHSHSVDLIVWSQGYGGVWRPENLQAALITGHSEAVAISLWQESLTLEYQNNITVSRNRSGSHVTMNKELTFTPHYITKLSARFNKGFLASSYTVRLVDRRFALPNNQKSYAAYRVDDFMIKGKVELLEKWRGTIEYRLYNIWNENYVLITHYPMPGREWSLSFSVSYGV